MVNFNGSKISILDKYILRQVIEMFIMGVCVFTSIIFASDTFITKLNIDIKSAKINIGFAILFSPIPQALITVISDFKLSPFNVITVASKTPIGIVITIT